MKDLLVEERASIGVPPLHYGMLIATLILSVAFAAFCIWLGVRIFNRRERWAKWMAVALTIVIVVGYPVSFGPAWWLSHQDWCPDQIYFAYIYAYSPLRSLRVRGPYPV